MAAELQPIFWFCGMYSVVVMASLVSVVKYRATSSK